MPAGDEELPPPVTVVNGEATSPFVLICEHASRFIPRNYGGLGLPDSELSRHIAWDIGAKATALELSRLLDAPLIHSNYSRLLIDLNRPLHGATLIPEISETTVIPGNRQLSMAERQARIDMLFTPFQSAVAAFLDRRMARAQPATIIAVHSFTPVFKGSARPWQLGVLYRRSAALGERLITQLGGAAAGIAANQPYQIEDDSDYTIPIHGEARGLDALLIEIRQDLIAAESGAHAWAGRLAKALSASLS